jgi:hypothetical protein
MEPATSISAELQFSANAEKIDADADANHPLTAVQPGAYATTLAT